MQDDNRQDDFQEASGCMNQRNPKTKTKTISVTLDGHEPLNVVVESIAGNAETRQWLGQFAFAYSMISALRSPHDLAYSIHVDGMETRAAPVPSRSGECSAAHAYDVHDDEVRVKALFPEGITNAEVPLVLKQAIEAYF